MPPAVPTPDPLASALAVLRPADVQQPSAAERIAGTLREEIVEGRVLPGVAAWVQVRLRPCSRP